MDAAGRRAHGRHSGVKVTTGVLPEEPAYALVRESRTAAAMVPGSRGQSSLAEALPGSVSVTVAGHAHCPVTAGRGSRQPGRTRQAQPHCRGRRRGAG